MNIPIIFLHGFPFNAHCWEPQVNYLKNKYQVFSPDLRGHGSAAAPAGPWMIAHFAQDLKIYMDEQKISQAILCGLSMGGYIALHFMADYAERVAGLILCDTRADTDSNETKDKRYKTMQKIQQEGLELFAEDFSKLVLGDTTLKEKPEIQTKVKQMILNNRPENVMMTLGALASRRDSTVSLKNIHCPTLVLVGAEDKVTPVEVNELMAKEIPNAQFHVIKGAGHISNLEQPQIFNTYLDEFLKKIPHVE